MKAKSQKNSGYLLYGLHPVQAALDNKNRRKGALFVTENATAKLRVPHGITVQTVKPAELDQRLPRDATHQGAALEVQPLPATHLETALATHKPLLMLDQVSDPHNVGAILRSAAAFDAGAVIVQDKHAPPENATIAKTAAGALEIVPLVHVTNLARSLAEAKQAGYWVIGLDGHTDTLLGDIDHSAKTLLVLGAEGAGLRRLVGESCDQLARLPIHKQMESLNVSVAAGIALYEITRGKS